MRKDLFGHGSRDQGKRFLHMKDGVVREKNAEGDVVMCFVGREIRRNEAADAEVLFTWRGTDVRRGDRNAQRMLYVTPGTANWAVACALDGMY
jgi:hypothetical protein